MPNFDFSWKKIILIIGFIAVTGLIGFSIYYVFFRAPVTEITTEEEKEFESLPISETTGKPITGEVIEPTIPEAEREITVVSRVPLLPEETVDETARGGVTRVIDLDYNTTNSLELAANGRDALTYSQDTGEFYRLTEDGERELLTKKTFPGVEEIAWAPKSTKAILEFPDGSNIFYDFEKDNQVTLPQNWTEFDFNETENQIAFKDMDIDAEKRFLAVANPDGSGIKYLEFVGAKTEQIKVNWSPTNQVIATFEEGGTSNSKTIYFIGQNNENFKALNANGRNVEMQYTPSGDRLIYSAENSYTDHKPVLNIVDASGDSIGQNHRSLNLNTWAHKCTFADSQTMYCAVPKEMPNDAGWFPELAEGIPDYIYKINLQTGAKSFIAEPEFEYSIESMKVSEDGSTLYFTDSINKTVHKLKLK